VTPWLLTIISWQTVCLKNKSILKSKVKGHNHVGLLNLRKVLANLITDHLRKKAEKVPKKVLILEQFHCKNLQVLTGEECGLTTKIWIGSHLKIREDSASKTFSNSNFRIIKIINKKIIIFTISDKVILAVFQAAKDSQIKESKLNWKRITYTINYKNKKS
jgi:hypothetical protein